MIAFSPIHKNLAVPLVALAIVMAARPSTAQVFLAQAAPDPNTFILPEQQFNMSVFGNTSNADQALKNLELQLATHINDIGRVCELPLDLREKLELAGRGDIERFIDRVEQKRNEFQGKAFDQQQIHEVHEQLRSFQRQYNQGLFEEGSLFARTAATILDTDQAARYKEALQERRAFHYRAKVELFITKLGDSLGLTADQRERFIEVVMEQTRPPRRFGHQYDQYIVMLKISRVPEDAFYPILDLAQRRVLSRHLQQVRGMEPFLKANGYLDEDDEERD